MMPASLITRSRIAFVEDIKVEKRDPVHTFSLQIYMGMLPIFSLDNGRAIAIIASIAVGLSIGERAIKPHVDISTIETANRATSFLKVSTPGVAFCIQRLARNLEMQPTLSSLDSSALLIKTKGAQIALWIHRVSRRVDMIGSRGIAYRCETWWMKLEHVQKALRVGRLTMQQVMRLVWSHGVHLPLARHRASGRRILHPLQRGWVR